jgi:hypothetical protein
MKPSLKLLFSIAVLLTFSCSKDSYNEYSNSFEMVSLEKIDKPLTGFAKIKMTIRNNSNRTLSCFAYLKTKKSGTTIETKSMAFSNMSSGEKQIEEAWFSQFEKHSEYDQVDITLSWNVDSFGYEKQYIR